jgi:hypothetical protein
MVATTRSRPPQGEEARTSRSSARRSNAAQVQACRGDGGAGLGREDGGVWGRAAVAGDCARQRARGEDAVVEEQVHCGAGDKGRQLLQEFDGLEEEVRGAIAPHRLEFDEEAPIGAEAVLGERHRLRCKSHLGHWRSASENCPVMSPRPALAREAIGAGGA